MPLLKLLRNCSKFLLYSLDSINNFSIDCCGIFNQSGQKSKNHNDFHHESEENNDDDKKQEESDDDREKCFNFRLKPLRSRSIIGSNRSSDKIKQKQIQSSNQLKIETVRRNNKNDSLHSNKTWNNRMKTHNNLNSKNDIEDDQCGSNDGHRIANQNVNDDDRHQNYPEKLLIVLYANDLDQYHRLDDPFKDINQCSAFLRQKKCKQSPNDNGDGCDDVNDYSNNIQFDGSESIINTFSTSFNRSDRSPNSVDSIEKNLFQIKLINIDDNLQVAKLNSNETNDSSPPIMFQFCSDFAQQNQNERANLMRNLLKSINQLFLNQSEPISMLLICLIISERIAKLIQENYLDLEQLNRYLLTKINHSKELKENFSPKKQHQNSVSSKQHRNRNAIKIGSNFAEKNCYDHRKLSFKQQHSGFESNPSNNNNNNNNDSKNNNNNNNNGNTCDDNYERDDGKILTYALYDEHNEINMFRIKYKLSNCRFVPIIKRFQRDGESENIANYDCEELSDKFWCRSPSSIKSPPSLATITTAAATTTTTTTKNTKTIERKLVRILIAIPESISFSVT
ncbi:hypothetical protein SSS_01302 [Sarcoptes scabiei]|uniref:Uncharacterized protein n=1 Tax=Sarcoptes scabiei TaxID=52283 RepID=A0A834R7N1_SARSC|nr:hypothetical protein SSS_01302 [Sarcoptes scabiei]